MRTQHEVFFQAFDEQGSTLGEPRQLTRTPSASLIPAIRRWRTGFILVWNEADLPAEPAGHTGHVSSRIVSALVP